MKIGIHHSTGSYSESWITYCKNNNIPYKLVNAYNSDIVKQLEDCHIFMWHYHHANPKDVLFAKQLLYSLEQTGKIVYPNWHSGWHFDDKLGQKYLLEAAELPLVKSFAFYSKKEAIEWASKFTFPAVFKLRGGAGSYNVKLIKTRKEALSLIKIAFGKGFRQYDPRIDIKERLIKFSKGHVKIYEVIKAIAHLFLPYQIEKSKGRERGYFYVQEFIPDCKYDIRIQMVGNKGYAMKRYVRKNDFRASGGGDIDYDGSNISKEALLLAQSVAKVLKMQTLAIDLLEHNNSYLIAEISFAYGIDDGELDFGYFDSNLNWHKGVIDPFGWMVEDVVLKYNEFKR